MEETMEALHDVIKAGKARYIGASSMWAWQFSGMQYSADLHGWTRFVSMQNQYNLIQREEEREMFPLLKDQGIGSIPWSPLAKGRLTRPFSTHTHRFDHDPVAQRNYGDGDQSIIDVVEEIASQRGVPMASISIAWVLKNPIVASPIVGPTKAHHLADAVAALDISLTPEEIEKLEGSYTPRQPSGYI